MEELEQTGSFVVAAETDVAELGTELVGEHESRVDDLACVAVADLIPVGVATSGSLTSPIIDAHGSQVFVGQSFRLTKTNYGVLPEQRSQPLTDSRIGRVACRIQAFDDRCGKPLGRNAGGDRRVAGWSIE